VGAEHGVISSFTRMGQGAAAMTMERIDDTS
jgi:hypothetical protein